MLNKRWLMILVVCLMLSKSAFCFSLYEPKESELTGDTLTKAYEMKLEYYKSKISYDTAESVQEQRIKDKDSQIQRDFWVQITTLVVLGYVATHKEGV